MAIKVASTFVLLLLISFGSQAVALTRNTYLGNSAYNVVLGITQAPDRTVYVTGVTSSHRFPGTQSGAQRRFGGGLYDMFVAHLSADLSTLIGATYLGGSGIDIGYDIAYDVHNDKVYVVGSTYSTDFPHAAGGAQPTYAGRGDTVIVALTPDLKHARATYLGGSGIDTPDKEPLVQGEKVAIAISPRNYIYVTGPTNSRDFPDTAGGAQPAYGGGLSDAYVAALTPDLKHIYQATYLGGSATDVTSAIAANIRTGIYVVGTTSSSNFPVTPGVRHSKLSGTRDATVTKLSPDLTRIEDSTYYGGSDVDTGRSIVLDVNSQTVYIAGITRSTDLPQSETGAQPVFGGVTDAFVADLNSSLSKVLRSSYLGGSRADLARPEDMALSASTGALYVSGVTSSLDFPAVAGGVQSTYPEDCSFAAFITEFTPDLTEIVQSTYLGGSVPAPHAADNHTGTHDLFVDPKTDDVYTVAGTPAMDIPSTEGAYQPVFGGELKDGLISVFNPTLTNP